MREDGEEVKRLSSETASLAWCSARIHDMSSSNNHRTVHQYLNMNTVSLKVVQVADKSSLAEFLVSKRVPTLDACVECTIQFTDHIKTKKERQMQCEYMIQQHIVTTYKQQDSCTNKHIYEGNFHVIMSFLLSTIFIYVLGCVREQWCDYLPPSVII